MDVKGKSVFLSGPMTGKAHLNVAAFAEAHQRLKEAGAATVYDPAIEYLQDAKRANDLSHAAWMRRCLRTLASECATSEGVRPRWDVLVSLPGWVDSAGAALEREVAVACGVEWHTLDELDAPYAI